MRTAHFAVAIAVVGMLALGAVGCDEKHAATLMLNRQLQSKLIDKDLEIAQLRERTGHLAVLLKERDQTLKALEEKNDNLQKSFDELLAMYKDIAAGIGAARPDDHGPLPPGVSRVIREIAKAYPNLFTFNAATGELRFNSDVTFASGSFVVKPDASKALVELAKVFTMEGGAKIQARIVGHTDNVPVRRKATIESLKRAGVPANNNGLSIARGRAVGAIFEGAGVAKSRIRAAGLGAGSPIADNKSAAGRAKNRRVEVFLFIP
ncbi:MAG: OmpA family protein [Planctomycetia bacterium]|nr:OmpA family protein [Planctomycetia bacterium]